MIYFTESVAALYTLCIKGFTCSGRIKKKNHCDNNERTLKIYYPNNYEGCPAIQPK